MIHINGLRFIVGSQCNYRCFYCHHEGYMDDCPTSLTGKQLQRLYDFAQQCEICNIAVTGGEPFVYWDRTIQILSTFNGDSFKRIVNTNGSLIHLHLKELRSLSEIEFHVNLASLVPLTHQYIVGGSFLQKELDNLMLLAETHHTVCLNIPALANTNEKELLDLYEFSLAHGFKPRFLILLPTTKAFDEFVLPIARILQSFGGGSLIKRYAYGLYEYQTKIGNIEIVQCLCSHQECTVCYHNTYLHLTPDGNIKYCMRLNDVVNMDYTDLTTMEHSVRAAMHRLEMIVQ